MRTLIDIPDEDLNVLNGVAKKLAISRAEFVRQAIAKSLEPHRTTLGLPAFGLWSKHPVDGVEYQRKMRGEW